MRSKNEFIKRFRYLWTWELLDSFLLPGLTLLAAKMADQPQGLFCYYGMALTALILWQGSRYWWLSLKALQANNRIAEKHLRAYPVFRTANWVMIGVLPIIMAVRRLLGYGSVSVLNTFYGVGFYTLAILEQINYYCYQLMYDTPGSWRSILSARKLRRSRLYRDLERI